MHDHRDSIRRRPHIELDALGASGECLSKGFHRVFRRMRGIAAMPYDRQSIRVKKRVQRHRLAISHQLLMADG
jgi:hypothetical protein